MSNIGTFQVLVLNTSSENSQRKVTPGIIEVGIKVKLISLTSARNVDYKFSTYPTDFLDKSYNKHVRNTTPKTKDRDGFF